jgi:adenylate cyclase
MSVVAAIEPSLRQAEAERVKRKRPENLDAYDLVLRAMPDVYPAMPDGAVKALPLLERALALEPDYALAHGFAAWCHEILFVRGGARGEPPRRHPPRRGRHRAWPRRRSRAGDGRLCPWVGRA